MTEKQIKKSGSSKYQRLPSKQRPSIHSLSDASIAYMFLGVLISLYIVYRIDYAVPTPLMKRDAEKYPASFIAENAQDYLRQLVELGPRVVGTTANEQNAVAFLRQEITTLKDIAHPVHKIELDVQLVSGAYQLELKPIGVTNVYRNMQNVVVKISPNTGSSNDSLLINCHFDSVPLSDGASDNGINCAVMLEILRVLTQSSTPLQNNVILLFNGAEENPLQAAHGFIMEHRWAKETRAVLNLEAGGSGGRAVVFQAGPQHPWLLKHYAKSAPHPHAQVLAEELFQANIIPSDTDFRLFRDFGKIPGLDIGFRTNGYVYHTRYDKFEIIPLGSFQHMGDNVLAVVRSLISSEEIKNSQQYSIGHMVYYDILGITLISYTKTFGIILNFVVSFCGLLVIYFNVNSLGADLWQRVAKSTAVQLLGWIVGPFICLLVAMFLASLNAKMSWYAKPWLVIGLYSCPVILGMTYLLVLLHERELRNKNNIGVNVQVQIHMYGNTLCWIAGLLVMNSFGIRSSHIFMGNVIFSTIPHIIIHIAKLQHSVRGWLWIYLLSVSIPAIFSMYTAIFHLSVIIPVTARVGASAKTDILVGLITSLLTILTCSAFVPLVTALKTPVRAIYCLAAIIICTIFAVAFTPIGFPYQANDHLPAPQRFFIYHTERVFYNKMGDVRKTDSGYFMWNLDTNSPQSIESYVPELKGAHCLGFACENEMFCGIPIFKSRIKTLCDESVWIPAVQPKFDTQTSLKLLSEAEEYGTTRLTFRLTGPDHMNIVICPMAGTKLMSWSFLQRVPVATAHWDSRPVYFTTLSYGKFVEPFEFWVEIETYLPTISRLDIAVTGHYMKPDTIFDNSFKSLLKKFPKWAHVTPFLSSYKLWVF